MRRATVRVILVCAAAVAVLAAAVAWWSYDRYTRPGPLTAETTIIIPKGAGVDAIADRLADAGVIAEPHVFALILRVTRRDHELHAGEFTFPPGGSMRQVALTILNGDTVKRRLTIAEGLTTRQIFALVGAADGLAGDMPPLVGDGELLPETYFFSYGDTRKSLIRRMQAAMKDAVEQLWQKHGPRAKIQNKKDAVTLASIIEKETAVASERPTVSSVFHNRLRRGMRLQSDPTVVYAITMGSGPLSRRLTYNDLAVESPYNTYRVGGLPPAPIANPGRASIAAALSPADSRYLYFVADWTGGHVFARTLAEHNRNVAKWRKIQKARAKRARANDQ